MKHNIFKKNAIITVLAIFLFSIFITIKISIFDNPIKLCTFAEWFDDPSTPYYLILNRIYKLSENKNFNKTLIEYIQNDKNTHLHKRYARILGVLGEKDALPTLKAALLKYSHNKNYKITADYIVTSLGLIGNHKIVPLLVRFLSKEKNSQVSQATLASALFLATGEKYFYINSFGKRQKYLPTRSEVHARKIIIDSRKRKRTYKEKILLDKLFRRPGSSWGYHHNPENSR